MSDLGSALNDGAVETRGSESESSTEAPRLRHICFDADIASDERPIIALCGYAMPTIDGFDMEGDLAPSETAECVVCLDLWTYWSVA